MSMQLKVYWRHSFCRSWRGRVHSVPRRSWDCFCWGKENWAGMVLYLACRINMLAMSPVLCVLLWKFSLFGILVFTWVMNMWSWYLFVSLSVNVFGSVHGYTRAVYYLSSSLTKVYCQLSLKSYVNCMDQTIHNESNEFSIA